MAQQQSKPSNSVNMGRPLCPACGVPMWLTYIEPHGEDHDKRTFECSVCKNTEIAVVKFK
jgi:hypothetical protein